MIARRWHGAVPVTRADEYLRLMREVALPDYRRTPGNMGAWCLRRIEHDVAHFEMLTFWEDIPSVQRFAGEDYGQAKYYDFDDAFLIEKEPTVQHHSVYDR